MGMPVYEKYTFRICRIATYPTKKSPGTGLPCYHLVKEIKTPTLYLTRKIQDDEFLDVPQHVKFIAITYPSPPFGARINLFRAIVKIAGLMKFFFLSIHHLVRFKPHIVHIHSPLYLLHAIFARTILGSKVCITFHGTDILRIEKSSPLKPILHLSIDTFFFVSKTMEKTVRSIARNKDLYYTPNGVDVETFKDLRLKREKLIVAVGNLRWQKGYEYLLRAFEHVKDRDYKLIIAGEGPERDKLEKIIREMGLNDRVSLPGRMTHEEIVSLLNRASIYVMSSVTEGFPKALVEAMACGTPVITTDVGSCAEIVGDTGIVVRPQDTAALAEALNRLAENHELRKRLGQLGARRAREFSWKVSTDVVLRAYRAMINIEIQDDKNHAHRTSRSTEPHYTAEEKIALH